MCIPGKPPPVPKSKTLVPGINFLNFAILNE